MSQWFTRAGKDQSLKEAIDLKWQLSAAQQKYLDLHIIGKEEDQPEHGSAGWVYWCVVFSGHLSVSFSCTDAIKREIHSQKQHERLPVAHSSASPSTMAPPDLSLDPTTQQAQFSAMVKRRKVTQASKWAPAWRTKSVHCLGMWTSFFLLGMDWSPNLSLPCNPLTKVVMEVVICVRWPPCFRMMLTCTVGRVVLSQNH